MQRLKQQMIWAAKCLEKKKMQRVYYDFGECRLKPRILQFIVG